MYQWRHSRVGRIVALVLLLWTAADLTNTGLCALESEGALDAVSLTSATALSNPSDTSAPRGTTSQGHIDDCFCCSHCVEFQAEPPAPTAMVRASAPVPLLVPSPRLFGASVYHPPLA